VGAAIVDTGIDRASLTVIARPTAWRHRRMLALRQDAAVDRGVVVIVAPGRVQAGVNAKR
jgi:hypothetical protein